MKLLLFYLEHSIALAIADPVNWWACHDESSGDPDEQAHPVVNALILSVSGGPHEGVDSLATAAVGSSAEIVTEAARIRPDARVILLNLESSSNDRSRRG